MDDQTRYGILARAEVLPEWERGQYIISETMKAVRAGDAQLSDMAIRAEFMTWCQNIFTVPLMFVPPWVIKWTRHILTCGGLTGK